MDVKITTLPTFDKMLKRYVKKFPSLKQEIEQLNTDLMENPEMGTDMGEGVHKIRLSVKSKGKGKSGGFRVITYIEIIIYKVKYTVYPVILYDKSEYSDVSKADILEILKQAGLKS